MYVYPTHDYIRMEITVLYLKYSYLLNATTFLFMNRDNTKKFKHFTYLATISKLTSSPSVLLTVVSALLTVTTALEDIRRCLNQALCPDTHSRNLIRLVRYSLMVPGRRVPFCNSRSMTSPQSPMVSSRRTASEDISERKNLIPVK